MKDKKYKPTEEELQIISDLYDGSTTKLNIIMMRLGRKYPRWYVKKMAYSLGLTKSTKMPNWSREEEQYLYDHYPRLGVKKLRFGLMRVNGGMPRTETAIHIKIKRMGMYSRDGEGFTMRGLTALIGSDHKQIEQWLSKGWLKGKRRGTRRTSRQGGDHWYFDPEWVRSFIINHPEEVDLRRVDGANFIRLLAGNGDILTACICPSCKAEHFRKIFNPGSSVMHIYCPACKTRHANEENDDGYEVAVG